MFLVNKYVIRVFVIILIWPDVKYIQLFQLHIIC